MKPNIAYEQICTYDVWAEAKKPLCEVYICFNQLFLHSPNVLSTSSDLTHHTIPDTELINGFV